MSNLNVNAISPQSGSTLRLTSNLNITGHVTASGNISASGTVFADNFQSTGGDVAGISFNDDFNLTGDMTGSGNLEIAGNISGSSTSTGSFGHVRMNGKDLPPIFVTGSSIYLGGEGTGTGDDGSDNNNVGIGDDVLSGIGTGARNVAIGLKAMENRVAASENVAIGYRAGGPGAQKMGQNTLVGVDAGYSLDGSGGTYNATSNTYIGHQAGDGATEGLKNTAIGDNSARSLVAGSSNVFLGYFSGNGGNTEGGTYIGENTVATDGASREIVIGKTAIGKGSNTVVLGDDNITDIYMSEDVGAKLHTGDVSGSAISTGSFGELKISGVGQEKISLLGGTDQYINFGDADDYNIGAIKYRHSSDNQMQFITNNTMGFFITNNQDIGMKATGKFYFDGGFNTFFAESSADNIRFTAGAVPILDLTTTSISGSSTSTGSFATIRTGTTIGSLSSGISFGDGDTGIYEKTDDNIVITAGNSLESLKIAPTAVTWRTDSFNINTSTNTYYGIRMSPDNSTNTILLAGSGHQTIDFSKTGVLKTSTTTNSNGAAFTFQGTMDQLGSFSATSQFVKLDPVMSSSNAVATSSYTMLDMAGTIDMTGQTQETIRSLHIHPTKTNIVNYTAIDADGDIITTGNISGSATSTGSFGRIESSGDMGIDGNIDVKGNVTARNFIVSSSVTNITYQSLSGSTIFGDSADDTHVFGGNTISGSSTSTGSFGVLKLASYNSGLGGSDNTIFGIQTGEDLTSGNLNTLIGRSAGQNLTTSTRATFIGSYVGFAATDGASNTIAIGTNTMDSGTGTTNAVFIGRQAGQHTAGSHADGTVAIGHETLRYNTTGRYNTAVGYASMRQMSNSSEDGDSNTALGYATMYNFKPASDGDGDNTVVGTEGFNAISQGTSNTGIGSHVARTGTNDLTTGTDNTLIGSYAALSTGSANNQTVIGKGTIGIADNSVTIGNTAVTDVYFSSGSTANLHTGHVMMQSASFGMANHADRTNSNAANSYLFISQSVASKNGYVWQKAGNPGTNTFPFLLIDASNNQKASIRQDGRFSTPIVYLSNDNSAKLGEIDGDAGDSSAMYINANSRALQLSSEGKKTFKINTDGTTEIGGSGAYGVTNFGDLTVGGNLNLTSSAATLEVAGNISGSSISTGSFGRVEATTFAGDGASLTNVPDYVYESNYVLQTIPELEIFVTENKHLPNVPDMNDMDKWKTLNVGDRDMLLLEKIEELSLYIIQLNKRIEKLEKQ